MTSHVDTEWQANYVNLIRQRNKTDARCTIQAGQEIIVSEML